MLDCLPRPIGCVSPAWQSASVLRAALMRPRCQPILGAPGVGLLEQMASDAQRALPTSRAGGSQRASGHPRLDQDVGVVLQDVGDPRLAARRRCGLVERDNRSTRMPLGLADAQARHRARCASLSDQSRDRRRSLVDRQASLALGSSRLNCVDEGCRC